MNCVIFDQNFNLWLFLEVQKTAFRHENPHAQKRYPLSPLACIKPWRGTIGNQYLVGIGESRCLKG